MGNNEDAHYTYKIGYQKYTFMNDGEALYARKGRIRIELKNIIRQDYWWRIRREPQPVGAFKKNKK